MHSKRFFTAVLMITSAMVCSAADAPAAYKQCVNCHGPDGHGKTAYATKTPVPDFRSASVQDLSDTELYDTIARGTRHRNYPHAFMLRGMKDQDVRELVQFVRSVGSQAK